MAPSPATCRFDRTLAERIEAIESGDRKRVGAVTTGWDGPSAAAQLSEGALHEWYGAEGALRSTWAAPLLVLSHLARRALAPDRGGSPPLNRNDCSATPGHNQRDFVAGQRIVWIGKRVRPHLGALALSNDAGTLDRSLLERSLFVDADALDMRVWAIDLALRCPAVAMVIADGSGVTMAQSRRLQVAAQSEGGIALLARPPWEIAQLSCAATRWRVNRVLSPTTHPRWIVQCVRCKGMQRGSAPEAASQELLLEGSRASGCIRVAAHAFG